MKKENFIMVIEVAEVVVKAIKTYLDKKSQKWFCALLPTGIYIGRLFFIFFSWGINNNDYLCTDDAAVNFFSMQEFVLFRQ